MKEPSVIRSSRCSLRTWGGPVSWLRENSVTIYSPRTRGNGCGGGPAYPTLGSELLDTQGGKVRYVGITTIRDRVAQ
jgi:hypothetical protein